MGVFHGEIQCPSGPTLKKRGRKFRQRRKKAKGQNEESLTGFKKKKKKQNCKTGKKKSTNSVR